MQKKAAVLQDSFLTGFTGYFTSKRSINPVILSKKNPVKKREGEGHYDPRLLAFQPSKRLFIIIWRNNLQQRPRRPCSRGSDNRRSGRAYRSKPRLQKCRKKRKRRPGCRNLQTKMQCLRKAEQRRSAPMLYFS